MCGTSWRHLFFIGRQLSGIASWRRVADFEDCIWLGYVSRRDFERAMARAGRSSAKMVDVTVSPAGKSARTWGWLRAAVKWVRLKSLTRQWWLGNGVTTKATEHAAGRQGSSSRERLSRQEGLGGGGASCRELGR
eukprot:1221959-Rhodomonas_salina.1